MRVALLPPNIYTIPPRGYGGEIMVWDLACGLAELGVEVELFGIAGSQCPPKGRLHYMPQFPLELFLLGERAVWHFSKHILDECDVVHSWSHSGYVHNSIHFYGRGNSLQTLWGTLIPAHFLRRNLCGWSQFHRQIMIQQGAPETTRFVHGGCDTQKYCPDSEHPYEKDGFLFLSRMYPSKRVEVFLSLAKRFPNERFVLSGSFGKVGTPDHAYYGNIYRQYAEKLSNDVIEADVSEERKIQLFRSARAVIFPSLAEAFGLILVEALSCACPVIASRDGSFPELIREGETGFLAASLQDFEKAIRNVDALEPKRCREDAVKRWDRSRVAADYLKVYKDIANNEFF